MKDSVQIVITDTSAIYALVDKDDFHHQEAVNFVKQFGARLVLCVPEPTLFETLTLINARLGHSIAIRVLTAIHTSDRYRLISLTDEDKSRTWDTFAQYADKKWSPFDCTCLAVARNRKIRHAFAFDVHFDQMAGAGLIRLP